jgi:hypothetical protein
VAQLEHIDAIEKRLWNGADTLRANSNYAGERDHPVGHLRKEMFPEPPAPENEVLGLAAGAEHPLAATETHDELGPAVPTGNTGEAVLEDPALEKPRYNGPTMHSPLRNRNSIVGRNGLRLINENRHTIRASR